VSFIFCEKFFHVFLSYISAAEKANPINKISAAEKANPINKDLLFLKK